MVTSLWIVLLITIEPLWSPWWTSQFPPNLVLYIVKKLIASTAIFSHSFDHRAFNRSHKPLYGHLIMDCAFDDDRTIVVAKVEFAISANVVLHILKSLFNPFRMTIYHMLSVV